MKEKSPKPTSRVFSSSAASRAHPLCPPDLHCSSCTHLEHLPQNASHCHASCRLVDWRAVWLLCFISCAALFVCTRSRSEGPTITEDQRRKPDDHGGSEEKARRSRRKVGKREARRWVMKNMMEVVEGRGRKKRRAIQRKMRSNRIKPNEIRCHREGGRGHRAGGRSGKCRIRSVCH